MELKALIFFILFSFSTVSVARPNRIEKSDLSSLKALNEQNTLASLTEKKEKLLYFWATWCDVCKSKLTTVFKKDSLYSKYDIYLVATDQDLKKIEHTQKKLGLKNQVVIDVDRKLQNQFEIYGVPTLIRLSPDGQAFAVKAFQTGGDIEALLE